MFNKEKLESFHNKNYKKLILIPIIILTLSLLFLGIRYSTTGEFIEKDVTLKGGLTITIYTEQKITIAEIENLLKEKFPNQDIIVRKLTDFNTDKDLGIIVEAAIDTEKAQELKDLLKEKIYFTDDQYSIEETGATLGQSFFREMIKALIFAFIFMGIVVLIAFRSLIPSLTIIFSAFFDMIVTLSIISLAGVRLSTAGIAAFLLILGYSIDTNILLTVKVLKRKENTVFNRILNAMKTGLTMTCTTVAALSIGYFVTSSLVLKQIFMIILIALLVDTIATWIMNASILRIYLNRKNEN